MLLFFKLCRPPPVSLLFPYTTLFRSACVAAFGLRLICHSFKPVIVIANVAANIPERRFALRHVCCATNSVCFRARRSEEHTSELQSRGQLVCRLLLEKKKASVNTS